MLGYGADAICPYLAFELAFALRNDNIIDSNLSDDDIYCAYQKAIETGIAKVNQPAYHIPTNIYLAITICYSINIFDTNVAA